MEPPLPTLKFARLKVLAALNYCSIEASSRDLKSLLCRMAISVVQRSSLSVSVPTARVGKSMELPISVDYSRRAAVTCPPTALSMG